MSYSTSNIEDGIDLSKPLFAHSLLEVEKRLSKREEAFILRLIESISPLLKTPSKKWLTRQEAAKYLNVSLVSLDGFIKKGKLKSYRPSPDRILFDVDDLDEFVKSKAA